MAKEGLRTLAYAYKDVDIHTWDDMRRRFNDFATDEDKTNIEREFTFVAVFGLIDNLKDGVRDSIEKLKAG